jgi:hypothetical protein
VFGFVPLGADQTVPVMVDGHATRCGMLSRAARIRRGEDPDADLLRKWL